VRELDQSHVTTMMTFCKVLKLRNCEVVFLPLFLWHLGKCLHQEQKQDRRKIVSLLCANSEHSVAHSSFPIFILISASSHSAQLLNDSRRRVLRDSECLEECEEQLVAGSVKGLDQVNMQHPRWQVVVLAEL
jgi:hypothetical protein